MAHHIHCFICNRIMKTIPLNGRRFNDIKNDLNISGSLLVYHTRNLILQEKLYNINSIYTKIPPKQKSLTSEKTTKIIVKDFIMPVETTEIYTSPIKIKFVRRCFIQTGEATFLEDLNQTIKVNRRLKFNLGNPPKLTDYGKLKLFKVSIPITPQKPGEYYSHITYPISEHTNCEKYYYSTTQSDIKKWKIEINIDHPEYLVFLLIKNGEEQLQTVETDSFNSKYRITFWDVPANSVFCAFFHRDTYNAYKNGLINF